MISQRRAHRLLTLEIVNSEPFGLVFLRPIVSLNLLTHCLMAMIAVLAAWLGFGAYSFAIPAPIAAAVGTVLTCAARA